MNQESPEIDHTCSQVGNNIMLLDNPLYLGEKIQPTLGSINQSKIHLRVPENKLVKGLSLSTGKQGDSQKVLGKLGHGSSFGVRGGAVVLKAFEFTTCTVYVFPGGSDSKMSAYDVGDQGSIPGLGRSPGEGNGNPLQYSCLENPMGGGTWQATVRGAAKSQTRLSDIHFTFLYLQCMQLYIGWQD